MEPDAALPTSTGPHPGAAATRWTRSERWLTTAVLGIFLANLVVSFTLEPKLQWSAGPVHHYAIHLAMSLVGLNLLLVPALGLRSLLLGDEFGPVLSTALLLWAIAMLAVAAVLRFGRDVPPWRRGVYAYLIAAQISGFAAVQWSTMGN